MKLEPTLLKTYTQIQEIATGETQAVIDDANTRMCNAAKRHADATRIITAATMQFLTTGVAQIPEQAPYDIWWIRWGQRSRFQWYGYFRQLARDAKRPFVSLDGYARTLTISKRKYLEPVLGPFLLAGREFNRARWWDTRWPAEPVPPVTWRQNTVNWTFDFWGDPGEQLKQSWLEQCRTNPAFRRALRLP